VIRFNQGDINTLIFGIILIILLALLAVAVIVAIAGYVYQFAKRKNKAAVQNKEAVKTRGVATSAIDKSASVSTAAQADPPTPSSK